ncbi:unnamed protein product [Notodromas monacha]|uniref:FGFR1 oncogene partner (FOP) N-terminal dimerisation domain-containing protein n=2 Tax=Notodromas monacha TaxID=399045 RepID=A0A7R9C0P0_9CRUS|nr:unnamed protein product [Notodromas monacha]CAG0923993.1 unnamed protein product [Notodromas monacha]
MSGDNLVTDDDSELRDMVANLLERNGTLAKIRAQLRASVFLALDEKEDALVNQPLMNHQMKNFLNTDYGRQCVSLVWEFLEFFNLDYTLSVFMRESYALTSSPGDNPDSDKVYNGRDHLKRKLGINQAQLSIITAVSSNVYEHWENEGLHHDEEAVLPEKSTEQSANVLSSESDCCAISVKLKRLSPFKFQMPC